MSFERRQLHFQLLKKCYQQTAEKILSARVELYSQKLRLRPTGLGFRAQKSIWGSCSATNRISLNWKLIIAPLSVLDYVVVHELAHIRHKNHSQRFWALVEKNVDKLDESKRWLKTHHYKADFLSKRSELWPK